MTKEHVIPRSWGSILDGGLGNVRGHALWYVHRTYDPIESGEPVTLIDVKRAKTPAFVSRKFCEPCQGGWMRELDESVRDLIARLTPTTFVLLSAQDQRSLACWAVKTMLVYLTKESEERQQEFGVLGDYRRFGESRAPLPGTHVWIGVREVDEPGWFRGFSATLDARSGATCDAHGAAVAVGQLAAVIIAPTSAAVTIGLRGNDAAAMKRIWPSREKAVQWPPALQIKPRDLTTLIASVTNSAVVMTA